MKERIKKGGYLVAVHVEDSEKGMLFVTYVRADVRRVRKTTDNDGGADRGRKRATRRPTASWGVSSSEALRRTGASTATRRRRGTCSTAAGSTPGS
jgi:hypothetical protein